MNIPYFFVFTTNHPKKRMGFTGISSAYVLGVNSILIKSGIINSGSSYEISNSGVNSAVIFWYNYNGSASMYITSYYSAFNESKDGLNIKRTTTGENVVVTASDATTYVRYFLIK